jgi:dCTP diphosphatase
MSEIDDLQKRIIEFRDARDWKQFHNPKDVAISLVLEASELLEHFQWKSDDEMQSHVVDKKTEVSEELADVLYWVLLLANDLKIDVYEALSRKMDINEAKYPVHKAKGSHKKYTDL